MFESLQEAAKGLLVESCGIANETGLTYVVCGGWSPYLRNASPIPHPGTKDVDFLFEAGHEQYELQDAVKLFLSKGYLLSAKHEFQLLRPLTVNGHDFVFNVDFLHPMETRNSPNLFVDHWELPVPVNDFGKAQFTSKSIALPDANFVFQGYIENETVESKDVSVEVPLIDETALLITKSKSYQSVKMTRDIFDAYLAITQPKEKEAFKAKMATLKKLDGDTYSTLEGYKYFINDPKKYHRSKAHFKDAGLKLDDVRDVFVAFLSDAGFGETLKPPK